MPQATTLSLLALVTTLGGILGTQLGKNAIAEMDPVFFNERPAPATFYAEYQPAPSALPTGPGWGYPYDWARPPVCWGCPGQLDPYLDAYVEPYVDPTDVPIPTSGKAVVRMVSDEPSMAEGDVQATARVVDRYASFPVTEDEAQRMRQVVEPRRGGFGSTPDGEADQAVGM